MNAAFMRGGVVVVVVVVVLLVEEGGSRSEGRLAQSWIAYFPPQQNPMTPKGMVVGEKKRSCGGSGRRRLFVGGLWRGG